MSAPRPFSRLDAWMFWPMPALRLATLRVLVGAYCVAYLLIRARALCDFARMSASRFEPVGAAQLLSGPLPHALVWLLWAACVVLAMGFTLGYRFKVVGPAFALLFTWVTSYRNSWGMIFHNENLTLLHVWVLAVSPAGEALTRTAGSPPQSSDAGRFGWPIRLLCIVTVCTYWLAGMAKLRLSGVDWIEGDVLRAHIAADTVRKQLIGSVHSALGLWLVRYRWPFELLSPLTLLVELGAPLALLGRRIALPWVAAVWAFHTGVALLMAIAFPYPMSGVALAPFLRPERIWQMRMLRPVKDWLEGDARGCTTAQGPLA
jgi:hypothetical protein